MTYAKEAVEGASKATASISLKTLKKVKEHLKELDPKAVNQTLETAADYIDTYFRSALDSRIMYDTWQEIYNDDLLVFIHTEFSGTAEEKLSELVENQVMKAFLFGYLAGVKDMDSLPGAIAKRVNLEREINSLLEEGGKRI